MGTAKKLVLWCVYLLLPLGLGAQIFIGDEFKGQIAVSDWSFLIDDTGELNLEDAIAMPFTDSLKDGITALNKINPRRKLWVRFDITADSSLSTPLAMRSTKFSHVRTYQLSGGRVDSSDVGLADIGHMHLEDYDESVVELNLTPGEKTTVVLSISHNNRSTRIYSIFVQIDTEEAFKNNHIAYRPGKFYEAHFFIFFCGLLIFQLLYVLLQWYLVRRIEYLYYVLYIASIFVYFYARFSVYFAESKNMALIDAKLMISMNDILLILPSFFYFRFARHFVELAVTDPKLGRQFRLGEWILVAGMVVIGLMQTIPNDWNKLLPIWLLLIFQFIFAIYSLARIARQRRTIARFLVAGSCMALLGHLLANALPFVYSSDWPFEPIVISMIGLLFELVIFNTGLLFKAKEAETEKVMAQRAYITELQNREKLKEEYRRSRDRISSDLHDDIGSTLSSIGIYNYAAQQKLIEGEPIDHLLSNISRSTSEAMSAMSDLVWTTNPGNDSNDKLVARIRAFAFEILEACNCSFSTEVDPEFLKLQLNQIQRKNILLIFKEAANNTAKHANASKCSLRISHLGRGPFSMVYSDNGRGFDPTASTGNGMHTMKKRAKELGGDLEIKSSEKGTCIILTIDLSASRELTDSNKN